MKIEGFIVHLRRATARRPQVEHLLATLPVETHVVDAVDGQALGDDETGRHYVKGLHQPAYPFALRQSEIACFLSHRKVWRMIVERGLDAGLIVEDDVALDMPLFGRCLEVAKRACVGKAYVQFRISPVRGRMRDVARDGEVRLVAPQVSQLGTVAQLVTREAAQHLLALTERFDRPVDTFLQMRWVTGIAPFCVVPSGISDQSAEIGGSTVSASGKTRRSLANAFGGSGAVSSIGAGCRNTREAGARQRWSGDEDACHQS
ncbi:glycosyl transferase family protein [Nitratireductor aquibiodomus RA22]|uniref:Glycosyl transferase family protein n=1 Tax=Nitratireductor aquibiodomus RA22 TaxID=1189611 RepID=I5BRC4_9HYPH|nr:glycosyltransferase family 25 protein [Nitratireductor aquibiodomus]EIM72126.1 glycosyl transferase family protein [Nitratireductor aquibiodomus RA22]